MSPRCSRSFGTTADPARCHRHSAGRSERAAALLRGRVATEEKLAIPPRCNRSSGKPGLKERSCLRRRRARQPLSVSLGHRQPGSPPLHRTAVRQLEGLHESRRGAGRDERWEAGWVSGQPPHQRWNKDTGFFWHFQGPEFSTH